MVTQNGNLNEYSLDGSGDAGLEEILSPDGGEIPSSPDDTPPDPTFDERLKAREAEIARREQALDEQNQAFARQQAEDARKAKERQDQQKVLDYYYQKGREYALQYREEFGDDHANRIAAELAKKDAAGLWKDLQLHSERSQRIAREENVPESVFANSLTEAEMRQEATRYKRSGGPENAEVAALKRQVAELTDRINKGEVKPTTYDRPGGSASGPGGRQRYVDSLKGGKPLPSAAEIDRITARYLGG